MTTLTVPAGLRFKKPKIIHYEILLLYLYFYLSKQYFFHNYTFDKRLGTKQRVLSKELDFMYLQDKITQLKNIATRKAVDYRTLEAEMIFGYESVPDFVPLILYLWMSMTLCQYPFFPGKD